MRRLSLFCAADTGEANEVQPRHIDLAEENVDGIGCFLEYLYTGDYFPRKLPGQRTLESDPAVPAVDDDGAQLLRHARVYTLASKFGLPELRTLASSKIHCVNSTAKGEIEYARYVYGHTEAGDKGVRAPVAQFWATRSHVLRSEAEAEFKGLCLEFPQFGYDVLSECCPFRGGRGGKRGTTSANGSSARSRREAQARQQGEDAAAGGQRAEMTEAEPRLSARSRIAGLLGAGLGFSSWDMYIYYGAHLRGRLADFAGYGRAWMGKRPSAMGFAGGSPGCGSRRPATEGVRGACCWSHWVLFSFVFACTIRGWELLVPSWMRVRSSLAGPCP